MRKTAADQTWLICMKAEILEVSCTSVISRLNNNKQDATVVARGFEENKKWLMFLQGKRQHWTVRRMFIEVQKQHLSCSLRFLRKN